MQSKLFVVGVALAAVLYVTYEWMVVPAPAPLNVPAAGASTATAAPSRPGPPPAGPASAPAAAAGPAARPALPSSADLARKFNGAASMRAFVYEALKRPEEGGYQYAFAALELCKYDGTSLRLAPTANAQQKAAYERLARRCDMSGAERDAARRQITADRRASYDRDPYLALAFEMIAALDAPQRRRVVAAILASGDPLALWYLNTAVQYLENGRPMSGVYFGGRYYPNAVDDANGIDVFAHAMELAVCSLGIDCGPESAEVLMMCVDKGWCGESVREAMRTGLGPERAAMFAQIEALAARLVVEIRHRNVAAFVPG